MISRFRSSPASIPSPDSQRRLITLPICIRTIDDSAIPGFDIPYSLIGGVAAVSAAFLFFVFTGAIKNRQRPVVAGREYLIGAPGEALEDFDAEGWARVQGETWRVRAGEPVRRGDRLKVKAIDGLVLTVEVRR